MNIKKEELQGLIKYAEQIKTCINENKKEDALHLVRILQENVSGYIKENIDIGTNVKVVNATDSYDRYKDFIGAQGVISGVVKHFEYPYEIDFADEELQERCNREGGVLWKLEELEVI